MTVIPRFGVTARVRAPPERRLSVLPYDIKAGSIPTPASRIHYEKTARRRNGADLHSAPPVGSVLACSPLAAYS